MRSDIYVGQYIFKIIRSYHGLLYCDIVIPDIRRAVKGHADTNQAGGVHRHLTRGSVDGCLVAIGIILVRHAINDRTVSSHHRAIHIRVEIKVLSRNHRRGIGVGNNAVDFRTSIGNEYPIRIIYYTVTCINACAIIVVRCRRQILRIDFASVLYGICVFNRIINEAPFIP